MALMKVRVPITGFAPAERVPIEIVRRQAASFLCCPLPSEWRNSPFQYIFVLNRQRQIVFANRNVQQLTPSRGHQEPVGMRFGEALDCVRATEREGGCGTTENCRDCGVTQAILNGLAGRPDLRELRLFPFGRVPSGEAGVYGFGRAVGANRETFCVFGLSDSREPEVKNAIEQFFSRQVSQTQAPG